MVCVQVYHTDMKTGLLWKRIYLWSLVVLCMCRFIIIEVKGACNPDLLHICNFFSFQDSQLLNRTVSLFDNCVVPDICDSYALLVKH